MDPTQIEIVSPAETADVSYADLNTIEPNVFSQLLSSVAFHLPDETEMLRCLRLGPTSQPLHFHTARARRVNAILLLGHGGATAELVHRNSGIYSSALSLRTGDLVLRRGKAASDWQLLVSPSAAVATAHPAPALATSRAEPPPAALLLRRRVAGRYARHGGPHPPQHAGGGRRAALSPAKG